MFSTEASPWSHSINRWAAVPVCTVRLYRSMSEKSIQTKFSGSAILSTLTGGTA